MKADSVTEPDRRSDRRPRVLKGGSIVTDVNESEITCVIRNMHAIGAELLVSADQFVPEEFMLYVTVDQECHQCRIRWRRNDRIGVAFQGRASKPKWHYGQ